MLSIEYSLIERAQVGFKRLADDRLVEKLFHDDEKLIDLVIPVGWTNRVFRQLERTNSPFALSAMVDLGSPFLTISAKFVLLRFEHKIQSVDEIIKISNWKGITCDKRNSTPNESYPDLPNSYLNNYMDYIHEVENWVNEGKAKKDSKFDFCEISCSDFDSNHPYPSFYAKQAREIRKYFEDKQTNKLEDVVELLIPHEIKSDETSKIFSFAAATYPLDIDSLRTGDKTSIQLKTGDIIVGFRGNDASSIYLYNEDDAAAVYAPAVSTVLRPKGISSEYLFLYLTSETIKIILRSLLRGSTLPSVSKSDFLNIPVVAPEKADDFYREEFLISNYKALDYLELTKRRSALISAQKESLGLIESILATELITKAKMYLNNNFFEFFKNDVHELERCYEVKAYKATIVLAGCILETLLIDWLSEIDDVDYSDSKEGLKVNLENEKRKVKLPTLKDYIDALQHRICFAEYGLLESDFELVRQTRNKVHATNAYNSEAINRQRCEDVIDAVNRIVEGRRKSSSHSWEHSL